MKNITYESFTDKNIDLRIFKSHNTYSPLHFHRSFEMIYVLNGRIRTTVGNTEFDAETDDIIFVQKYYPHAYQDIEDYDKYVLIIPPDLYNDFEKNLEQNTLPSVMTDKIFNRELLPTIEKLCEKHEEKSILIKKGYVNVIIGELISHYPLEPIIKNNNVELLVKILDYIDENYYKELSLDSISAQFGYNKYYFSKLFNRFIGQNINSYINIVRLQQMMKKAKQSDKINITELAYECGFDSLSTFYRYFNKVYGISPKNVLSSQK